MITEQRQDRIGTTNKGPNDLESRPELVSEHVTEQDGPNHTNSGDLKSSKSQRRRPNDE